MVRFTDCKINIGLDIVARRPDGYHDIVTAMVPVRWHDVVEAVPADATSLTVLGNAVDCEPERNLVMRAYRLLEKEYGIGPLQLVLKKVIPDGAGLGGGSGDATAMLLLLNDLCGLNLPKDEIAALAAKLGADCPFFVYDRPMLATGIGIDLTPIDLSLEGRCVLIAKRRGISISTRQAYAGVTPRWPQTPLPDLLAMPVEDWQGHVKNDFEPSIFAIAPVLADIKRRMLDSCAVYASMSGSGCAIYGIYNDESQALTAKAAFDGCDTFVGRL